MSRKAVPLRSDGHHRGTFRAKAHAGQIEHQVGLPVRREDEPRDSRRKQQRDRVPHESPAAGCATGRFGQVAGRSWTRVHPAEFTPIARRPANRRRA